MLAPRPFAAAARIAADGFRRRAVRSVLAAERSGLSAAASAYDGLTASSLALAGLHTGRDARRVNLVLPDATPWHRFAGVDTALTVAAELAALLGCHTRIVETNVVTRSRRERSRASAALAAGHPDAGPGLIERAAIRSTRFGDDDVWIATHWTTAHALQVAVRLGLIAENRVVYLIQDYEPGFSPWSTDHALAADTYAAGFLPLVNSTPVARVLTAEVGLEVPAEQVFAPALDLDRLAAVATRRTAGGPPRVLFYARPSKPRNLFAFGRAALRNAALRLPPDVELLAAGEPLGRDGADAGLRSLGRLAWDDYFALLAGVDVVVSLQLSAHPSHPPLEAAVSGALSVTNEFQGTRAGLHSRLTAVELSLDALTQAIVDAVGRAPSRDTTFAPLEAGALGGRREDALRAVARRL
jgi:hypothetical protein